MSCPLEMRKDAIGERFYASRNYNDLSQTYRAPGANRTNLDWNMTLRQLRKNFKGDKNLKQEPASMPNLHETHVRDRQPLVAEHVDGPYHSTTDTVGKYQNFASTCHMVSKLNRVSSTNAHTVDWHVNLRDSYHAKPDDKWRRYFTRSQQSFDMMKENCAAENEEYKKSNITPQDRRIDRRSGAISTETIRDDWLSFKRNPGCEGTQVGQWEHLIKDRRYGHKHRRAIGHETTLRTHKRDEALGGAKIEDTRSDGCLVELMGRKKWIGGVSHDPMSHAPPDGDAKLFHLSRTRVLPCGDEDNRELRKRKTERTDADISYKHTGKPRKKPPQIDDT